MFDTKKLNVHQCCYDDPLKKYLYNNDIYIDSVFSKNELQYLTFDEHNNIGKIKVNGNETTYFIKFSPLVDPVKYITNNYIEQKVESNNINLNLEKYINHSDYILDLHNDNSFEENMKKIKYKINYPMNCAYIDSFFTHLSTLMYNELGFYHGIHIFDTFTCIKTNYRIDIGDSLEIIDGNKEMYKNVKQEFVSFNDLDYQEMYLETNNINIETDDEDEFINNSKNKKPLIKIENTEINIENSCHIIQSDEKNNKNINLDEFTKCEEVGLFDISDSIQLKLKTQESSSDEDDDNSNESFTDEDSDEENIDLVSYENLNIKIDIDSDTNSLHSECDESSDEYSSEDESEDNSEDEPEVYITIKKIPVKTIVMEKCKNTFDFLLEEEMINMEQLKSAIFQIIMNLLCYQKAFKMTHNDLHTNNIMYVSTKKKYLYYKFEKTTYKVPTFGKIYKVIDFGRSIFYFKNKAFASDSFNKNEDADTQYNCEPFFDNTKKRIENNFSFDLCRLGCSLYDFFIDEPEDVEKMKQIPLVNMILNWVNDDNNKNILYKADGTVRYPGFKIYKMIVRNVHNHTPEIEIQNPIFNSYIVEKIKDDNIKIFDVNKIDEFSKKWSC
tara:strand:+ start:2487 stop:4322 length:1836 start_codon:yes stop_codon:yes gene_type:complete